MLSNSYDSDSLLTFVKSSDLFLVPFGSTHHLKHSSSFFYLCIIDDSEKLLISVKKEANFLSAHDLIYNI